MSNGTLQYTHHMDIRPQQQKTNGRSAIALLPFPVDVNTSICESWAENSDGGWFCASNLRTFFKDV
jgi:hypothetical protein